MKDETRNKITDEVSELSVPDTHFDQQSNTHHRSFNKIVEKPPNMKESEHGKKNKHVIQNVEKN